MTNRPSERAHEFGPFRYDPAQRVLLRDGQAVPLEPKIIDTLEALLDHRGQVIEKADLIKRVWPDCVVDDVGISRNISILRKALDDDAGTYIETVPKRGYRFVAAVETATASAPTMAPRRSRAWIAAAGVVLLAGFVYWQFYRPSRFLPRAGDAATVAVIPLEVLTAGLDRDGFAAGFTGALAAELAKVPGVQLISPSTVERYRSVGVPIAVMNRVLGAEVVVEGTAQVLDGRLRIAMRMSDVRAGKLIWAEVFEASAGDRRLAQSEASRAAAVRIAPFLTVSR